MRYDWIIWLVLLAGALAFLVTSALVGRASSSLATTRVVEHRVRWLIAAHGQHTLFSSVPEVWVLANGCRRSRIGRAHPDQVCLRQVPDGIQCDDPADNGRTPDREFIGHLNRSVA